MISESISDGRLPDLGSGGRWFEPTLSDIILITRCSSVSGSELLCKSGAVMALGVRFAPPGLYISLSFKGRTTDFDSVDGSSNLSNETIWGSKARRLSRVIVDPLLVSSNLMLPPKWPCRSMDRIFGYGPKDGRSTRSRATRK